MLMEYHPFIAQKINNRVLNLELKISILLETFSSFLKSLIDRLQIQHSQSIPVGGPLKSWIDNHH